jgi:hypothetical protein
MSNKEIIFLFIIIFPTSKVEVTATQRQLYSLSMLWTERKQTKQNFWWGFKFYEQFCMSYYLKMLIKSKNLCIRKTCGFFVLKNLRFFWKNLQVKQAIEKPVPTLL